MDFHAPPPKETEKNCIFGVVAPVQPGKKACGPVCTNLATLGAGLPSVHANLVKANFPGG